MPHLHLPEYCREPIVVGVVETERWIEHVLGAADCDGYSLKRLFLLNSTQLCKNHWHWSYRGLQRSCACLLKAIQHLLICASFGRSVAFFLNVGLWFKHGPAKKHTLKYGLISKPCMSSHQIKVDAQPGHLSKEKIIYIAHLQHNILFWGIHEIILNACDKQMHSLCIEIKPKSQLTLH